MHSQTECDSHSIEQIIIISHSIEQIIRIRISHSIKQIIIRMPIERERRGNL